MRRRTFHSDRALRDYRYVVDDVLADADPF